MRKTILKASVATLAAGAFAVGGFAVAGAVTKTATPKVETAQAYHACVDPDTSVVKNSAIYPNDADHPSVCYGGAVLETFASKLSVDQLKATVATNGGAITAIQGQISNLQTKDAQQDAAITQLQNTKANLVTATGTTVVTNWPETSGWAKDNFNRVVTIQRHSAVDAAKCGATAKTCWFYTGTLADNGTFVTVDGAQTPSNGDGAATISGIVHGTMIGGSQLEFYASSGAPDGSLVPATQDGKGSVGTSDWASQLFPEGTVFSSFNLPSYAWTYAAPATCEQWLDAVNPGDDGANPATDGNITGVNHCSQ